MSIDFELLKPSASMEITALTEKLKKAGRKVYPLSIGDTHFPPPKSITARINSLPAASSHYTSVEGIEVLRAAISRNKPQYSPSDIIVVPGLKQGIYNLFQALGESKICILEPAWLGYQAAATLSGRTHFCINTYNRDWLVKLASASFNLLVLCVPNNPDGKVFSESELSQIISIAEKNQAWIIADVIYEKYCYDVSFSSFYNKITTYDKLIIGSGYSKSYAMTGFRIGYLALRNRQVMEKLRLIQQATATCAPSFSQYLVSEVDPEEEIRQFCAYYKSNRDEVLRLFPEWEPFKPAGGFYYFIDLKLYGISQAEQFCSMLLQETGIALVPGNAYGSDFDSYVRLSFSIDHEILIEALTVLKHYLNENHQYRGN